jgi:hypothetical protein
MSQNPPENGPEFDKGFLDSDVDLQIGSPPLSGDVVPRGSGLGLPSIPSLAIGFFIACLILGGGYYAGYQQGLETGQKDLPMVILADKAPMKVPASELPETKSDTADDLNIYGVMRGDGDVADLAAAIVQEGPADSANGGVESLLEQSDTLAEIRQQAEKFKIAEPEAAPAPRVAKTTPVPAPKAQSKTPPKAAPKAELITEQLIIGSGRKDYMVQLAATRSRALARGTYSKLQEKHDRLLGRRDPLILRIDLREKGIFYRVNVPGFPHKLAASNFCVNLKERGQDCLVREQP